MCAVPVLYEAGAAFSDAAIFFIYSEASMELRFAGAAKTVTGSQTLVEHDGFSFLVDCGLYQGPKALRILNWEKPDFYNRVRAMVITHAHVDHCGLIPRWINWGWRGPIYCTTSTAALLPIMLRDAASLQEEDARFANVTKHSKHDPALPLYTTEDAEIALELIEPIPYSKPVELKPGLNFTFERAGHILGSALVQISWKSETGTTRLLTFSGDLGGGHSDLLIDPHPVLESDDLVLESTYGNRRVNSEGREERLAEVINKVIGRGGTLVIPAFALGRSQDLLLSIYRLNHAGKIPDVPVFLDSPMANEVTRVYLDHLSEMRPGLDNSDIREALHARWFRGVQSPDESMALCMSQDSKIVISASGMLQGGRVLHHLKRILPGEKNGVLFVGFQGKDTKGRLLQEGIGKIRIHHQEIDVEAEVFVLDGYSAHADVEDIMSWLKGFRRLPRHVFLNHGENSAQLEMAERIQKEFGAKVTIPNLNESFSL